MHLKSKLALAVGATLFVAGCGGGSSSSSSEPYGETETITISGRAADGYLMNATVCADLNASGTCDAGEPSDTTRVGGVFSLELTPGQTSAAIVVEAIANLTVDEDTGQPIPSGFTLRAPIDTNKAEQFVSPVTTMVSNELAKAASITLEQAKAAVAQRLQTSFDVMDDYVAAAIDGGDPTVQQNATRLHRVAQVTARIAAEMEAAVDQSTLDQLGMTMQEYLALASAQIENLLAAILTAIDAGMADSDFNPDDILAGIEIEDSITPPTQAPTNNDELTARFADAAPANPFYQQGLGGLEPITQSPITTLVFHEHSNLPGRYYYQGMQSEVRFADPAGDIVHNNIVASRLAPDGQFATSPSVMSAYNMHVRIWTGADHQFETIEEEMIGSQVTTPVPYGYKGSAYNDSIHTTAEYVAADLSYLNVRMSVPALLPALTHSALADVSASLTFPAGSAAYIRSETFDHDLYITSWFRPWDLDVNNCNSGPLISEVLSCNLLYGHGSRDPAQTLDDLTYPAGQDIVYMNYIGFMDGPTQYKMYLIGDKLDGSGEIRVFESGSDHDNGSAAIGGWEVVQSPFEHYSLTMPDGIHYGAFMPEFGIGKPFLHEHEGYLRAGWHITAGTEVEVMFGRDPGALVFNEKARAAVLDALGSADILVQHESLDIN